MKAYRLILANEDPHEYNDAEKVVADGSKEPSFADVRHMLELISSSAVLDDVIYTGVFQLFSCIEEALRRAKLSKEEFPICLLYKNANCTAKEPAAGSMYSTAWLAMDKLPELIKTAVTNLK